MAIGVGAAFAKGGTAKPCKANCTPPQVLINPTAGPILPTPQTLANGFSIVGFIQSVTVNGGCVAGSTAGGTMTVNGVVITIPSDTIVQFPAFTATWNDAACGVIAAFPGSVAPSIALDGTGGVITPAAGPQPGPVYPSVEVNVAGNIVSGSPPSDPSATGGVGAKHIAALVLISQISLNAGDGYISFIDYTDGSIYVVTNDAAGANSEMRLIINDPNGRFGRAQTTLDARFSVDDANPTIKTQETGYPMCVPRSVDANGVAIPFAGRAAPYDAPDDPLCPAKNRPISNGTNGANSGQCRNFAAAGLTNLPSGDINTTPAGQPCRAFVMKAIAGMPGTATFVGALASFIRGPDDPDPRQQVPFAVGDFITWQGTLVRGGNAQAPVSTRPTSTGGPGAGDVTWVHTIDANVGAFTQPKTLPSYVAVGGFGIGVEPQLKAAAVAGQETTSRFHLEASVTDVGSIVDVYHDDKGFSLSGPDHAPTTFLVPDSQLAAPPPAPSPNEFYRWITTEFMTGALTEQVAAKVVFTTSVQPFGGGIETQFVGPLAGRARIRAVTAPAIDPNQPCPPSAGTQGCVVTQSPTRYVRVVVRSLCAPASTGAIGTDPAGATATVGATNLNDGVTTAAGPWFDINGQRANFPGAGPGNSGVSGGDGTCLQSAQFANGLFTGQYLAPVFEYIFAEKVFAGAPVVPQNIWQLGFLAYGENGAGGNSTAPQVPQPW